jgi:hypothetical protein
MFSDGVLALHKAGVLDPGQQITASFAFGSAELYNWMDRVSDQGQAAIWGHDASAQAEQIIAQVAHPSARPGLREAGRRLGFRV